MSMILSDIRDWLEQNYSVIDWIQLLTVDRDFDQLEQRLLTNKKDHYDPKDLIVVNHFDTDYYDPSRLNSGLILGNLIHLFKKIDIPLHVLLIYTNHIGITKEVNALCEDRNVNDRPRVFETMIDRSMVDQITPWTFRIDTISRHAICLMGTARSHRHAIRNAIYHKDLRDRLYMAYRAKDMS